MFANESAQQTNGWSSECVTTLISSDAVPALVQVQSAIKETRTHPTICQNPPAYNPQSNGSAERESSTRSYVSGTGNENSSGPALGHHREDRSEGTGMDGRVVGGADQSVFGG